jgi:hypothetical protein
VASELARDCDGDDRAALAAPFKHQPASVETARRSARRGRVRRLPGFAEVARRARFRGVSPLVPGRFDQKPTGVRVAGPGDRAEAAVLAGRVPARRQAMDRAE